MANTAKDKLRRVAPAKAGTSAAATQRSPGYQKLKDKVIKTKAAEFGRDLQDEIDRAMARKAARKKK